MIAQQPSTVLQQPRHAEPISFKRIVALLQVALASRRGALTDDDRYWYTVARGM
jgi:hypothetical protein